MRARSIIHGILSEIILLYILVNSYKIVARVGGLLTPAWYEFHNGRGKFVDSRDFLGDPLSMDEADPVW